MFATKMKILIVDDVAIMRKVLRSILVDHCGIDSDDVIEAVDGADAILMYRECDPDVVFLDITMPDMDGKQVIGEFLKIDADAVIIMCTGSSDKKSVIDCIRAGARDYVRKPLTHERVQKALEKAEVFVNINNMK